MDDLLDMAVPSSAVAARVIMDELTALGVTDVVACPGSRSAPLAYAAWEAESAGSLRLHMRVDERSAGFVALGIAKATGRGVAIITTSGTAVANLAPALLEARHSYLPLIALTADRPSTLVGTGANQTTDQVGVLGTIPRLMVRVASEPVTPSAWRAAVRRAVVAAEGTLSGLPGPVHVNVEFNPPLLGQAGPQPGGSAFRVENPARSSPLRLDSSMHTVIVAGDMTPDEGARLAAEAERAQIPLLAEPSSNARSGSAAIAMYRHLIPFLSERVERVVVVGHPTLSRPQSALLARSDVDIIAVSPHAEWVDPGWAVNRVAGSVVFDPGDPGWMTVWKTADRELARRAAGSRCDGEVLAATVWQMLAPTDYLVVGSSNPIRDMDLAPISAHPPRVYSNRGLAGIDGTIATAQGVALGLGTRVTALVGDLATLHDLTSVAIPVRESQPDVTVIVADDGGGSIFSTLEYGAPRSQIGDLADGLERLFTVPVRVDVAAAAQALGAEGIKVASVDDAMTDMRKNHTGVKVIVVPIDSSGRRHRGKQLGVWAREAARAALGRV